MNSKTIRPISNELKSLLKSEIVKFVTRSDALVNCCDAHMCSANNELQSAA